METEEKLEQEIYYMSTVRRKMKMFTDHYQDLCHGRHDVNGCSSVILNASLQMKAWGI